MENVLMLFIYHIPYKYSILCILLYWALNEEHSLTANQTEFTITIMYYICLLHYYNYTMIKINKRYESHSLCKPLKSWSASNADRIII